MTPVYCELCALTSEHSSAMMLDLRGSSPTSEVYRQERWDRLCYGLLRPEFETG